MRQNVLELHGDAKKEWGAIIARGLTFSAISSKPKINSMTVQWERTGAGARQEGGAVKGGADIAGAAQGSGGNGRAGNEEDELVRRPGQVSLPIELRSGISAYGFWKGGNTAMFDIRIVNLHTGSYLLTTPKNALANVEKDKKGLYIQVCLERRKYFTPMVYSANGI